MRIGIWELLLIFGVVLVLFGAKKLPEIGQALGKAIKEFRKAGKDIQDESQDSKEEESSGPKD